MTTLLIVTTGQTDVQLVEGGEKHEFDKDSVGALHDHLRAHPSAWCLIDAPTKKGTAISSFPREPFELCTPKLDAVLSWFGDDLPQRLLLLETKRVSAKGDPRFAGGVLEKRAKHRGVGEVTLGAYLGEHDRDLEDRSSPIDAIVRREVVARIERAIAAATQGVSRVVVAATGGMPEVKNLVREIARLHTPENAMFESIEADDRARDAQPDVAVERNRVDPVELVRARRHALSLIEKGNLLGAWGAVSHLANAPGQEWTQVIKWLAHFASSLPMPPDCDLAVLRHSRMAARAALRVELALRADDIPRAVHGTVAFFEAALWDWLRQRDFAGEDLASGSLAEGFTFATEPTGEKKSRFSKPRKATIWCINDFKAGIDAWLPVLGKPNLCALWAALTDDVRNLRNDVAHNEPTPTRMNDARVHMQAATLWSSEDTFLSQPLVQAVLKELGEASPESLLTDLLTKVCGRLVSPISSTGCTP